MKTLSITKYIAGLVAAVALALPALGQGAILITNPGSGAMRNDTSLTVGLQFTVGSQNLSVTQLGAINLNIAGAIKSGGLANSTYVGLWDNTLQTLLASVTLSPGAGANTLFAYQTLGTPVTLTAGVAYRLGASFAEIGGDYWHNVPASGSTFSPDVNSVSACYSSVSGNFPEIDYTGTAFVGPNLQYVAVPEPSTYAMLGLGLGLLVLAGRKRRSSATG